MQRMRIEVLYLRPRTSRSEPGHKIYSYLLRGPESTRLNQVWTMDVTCIPMARGFVYLDVVLDWFSRQVMSWRLSIAHGGGVLRRDSRMPWPVTATPRSPIKARSSPVPRLPA